MGVYIYPPSSSNYKDTDYSVVINEINYWMCKGYNPYIGGDFNSRIGDINLVSAKSLKWRYEVNADMKTNMNQIHFRNMCETLKILPLNHMIYLKKIFEGGFTYYKANKTSQIDFVLTNNSGRRNIVDFRRKITS